MCPDLFPFWTVSKQDKKIFNAILGKSFRVRVTKYIRSQLESNYGFGDLECTFYALFALDLFDDLESLNKKRVSDYIFRFRSPIGGFASLHNWNPDVWSTFYAIASLKLLGVELNEDERKQAVRFILENKKSDGLFSHCGNKDCLCGAHSSYKSSFFAIASLYLLDALDKLDIEKFSRLLLKRIEKSNIEKHYLFLAYKLLNPFELIDDDLIFPFISNFQAPDGGFGKKSGPGTIFDTFWTCSAFKAFELTNKLNKGKIIKFISDKFKPDGGFNQDPEAERSDLISTSQASAVIFLLLPQLIEEVENGILQHVHLQKEVYVRSICDQFFVAEKLVLRLLKEMQSKYKWFSVDVIKYKDLFNTYLSHLPHDDQRIAKKTLDYILNKRMMEIDLTDFAKTFRRIPDKQERIKRVISTLIEKHFIIGSIEETKKRLRKTQVLKVYILPDNIIVRKKEFPYNSVIEEKNDLIRLNELLKKFMQVLPLYLQDFNDTIEILLESDEVELAREKLQKQYDSTLIKIEEQEKTIKKLKERFFLIDIKKALETLKEWEKIYGETKKELQKLLNKLDNRIKEREKIIQAYNELEDLVEFINKTLEDFKKNTDSLLAEFQRSCAKHELSTKRDYFLAEADKIEEKMRTVALDINRKITELYKITNKGALLKKVIISNDSSLAKGIITLDQDLEVKSQAFDEFLANQWTRKQSSARKRLEDMRSKIFKRDEILRIMDERKKKFDERLEAIRRIEDDEELNLAILRALDFITETNLFLDDYIVDTGKILDDFEVVAGDIPFLWTDLMEQMRSELEEVKKQTEKKIMDLKERSKKSEFDALIEKKIKKLNRSLDQLEELSRLDVITPENNLCTLIKERFNYLKNEIKNENKEIMEFLNKHSKEFKDFTDLAMVPLNRWKTYEKFMESSLRSKKDYLIDTVIQKLLNVLSSEANGGRVKLEELASLIGMNKNTIRRRLEQMIDNSKINAKFMNPNEIIPLTIPNLKQLEFENVINKFIEEQVFERVQKLFLNYCESHLLDENEQEIKSKLNEVISTINAHDKELRLKYSKQFENPYNANLIVKWNKRKEEITNNVSKYNKMLSKRQEFDALIKAALLDIKAHVDSLTEVISRKVDKFHDLDEVRAFLREKYHSHELKMQEHEEKLRSFINDAETELGIKKFKSVIVDLQEKYDEELSKIIQEIRRQHDKFEESFIEILEEDLKIELRRKIDENKERFYDRINDIEMTQEQLLENGNLDEAHATLKASFKELQQFLKSMDDEIKNHVTKSEKLLKVPNFKDSCMPILREWNIQELEEVLKRTKILLEDEIIKKNLIYMEKVYDTPRIPIQQLASQLGIKRNVLRSRLFRILGTSDFDNIKIDSMTNEIVFGMGRMSQHEMMKVLSRDDREILEQGKFEKKEKSLFQIFYTRVKSIIGFVSVFISLITALLGVSSWFYNLTGNILFFAILWIGYPLIVTAVVMGILFYYWVYPKKIKKKIKPASLLD
ncbi:MAG: prenyltransferase/squalene oxidase repeat-containing protein [Candidatus Helarchaeales archaeon]